MKPVGRVPPSTHDLVEVRVQAAAGAGRWRRSGPTSTACAMEKQTGARDASASINSRGSRRQAHELASRADRNAAALSLNTLWRNIADDNITAHSHFVRRKVDHKRPMPVFQRSLHTMPEIAFAKLLINAVSGQRQCACGFKQPVFLFEMTNIDLIQPRHAPKYRPQIWGIQLQPRHVPK